MAKDKRYPGVIAIRDYGLLDCNVIVVNKGGELVRVETDKHIYHIPTHNVVYWAKEKKNGKFCEIYQDKAIG